MSSTSAAAIPRRRLAGWRIPRSAVIPLLLVLLIAVALGAATIGAAGIPLPRIAAAFGLLDGDAALVARDRLVLWSVRLPRIAIAAMVGALLATAGALMQGLFRNPLADPGLVGVSAGAGFAAALTIVVGDRLLAGSAMTLPFELLPFAAFVGALVTTAALYRLATREGRTSIAVLLLGGIAIGALASAGIGVLVFVADDRQLRDITFWMLGSLGGSTWGKALTSPRSSPPSSLSFRSSLAGLTCWRSARPRRSTWVWRSNGSSAFRSPSLRPRSAPTVSVAGVIGFVGIVVPHLLRLIIGPGHRLMLPAAVFLGAILLLAADTVARVLAAPAEVPIGIITAVIGAPFFLALLLRQRTLLGL